MRRIGEASVVVAAVVFALVAAVYNTVDLGLLAAVAYLTPSIAIAAAAVAVRKRFGLTRVAQLLLFASATWSLGNFAFVPDHAIVRSIGTMWSPLPTAVLLHAVLSLPDGHLRDRAERWVVGAGYFVSGILNPVSVLLIPTSNICGATCPPGMLHSDAPAVQGPLSSISTSLGLLITIAAFVLVAARLRRQGTSGRRLMLPVLLTAIVAALSGIAGTSFTNHSTPYIPTFHFEAGHRASDAVTLFTCFAYALLPAAIVFGAYRTVRAVGVFGRLVPRLGTEPTAEELQPLLVAALGDPSLVLDLDPPLLGEAPGPHRAYTDVRFGGSLLARIEHDSALLRERDVLTQASDTLALLLGPRRLAAAEEATPQLARLREAFAAYVDVGVADRVLAEGVQLAPAVVEVTVMFLDVRDFTSFSEHRSPEEVLGLLNALWADVVPVVRGHGGHANKFMGDGLLAVFGAPDPLDDHADRAFAAAQELITTVENNHGVRIGIGLNTGPVVAGSVGGGGRVEFTVIGDVVNTAARVEAATKDTSDALLLTAATHAALSDGQALRPRKPVSLRGKTEPVVLYRLSPVPSARS